MTAFPVLQTPMRVDGRAAHGDSRARGRVDRRTASRRGRQECPQADQVVGCRAERHDPVDPGATPMPQLPQAADRFHPPEDLFDQFSFPLTDGIPGVTRGAGVNGTALDLLRDVRRHPERPHLGNKARHIEALIPANGAAVSDRAQQQDRGLAFGGARRGRDADIRDQSVAIVQQT